MTLDAEHTALKVQRSEIPKHVTVAELDEDKRLDALSSSEKLLLDIVRMIAYRAETRMMSAVAAAQGAKQRPRRPLAELFQSDADIAGLLGELNRMRTVFPGTGLRMIYELPDNARKLGPKASL